MSASSFEPIDGKVYPRFSGIKTFYRLPHLGAGSDISELDIGILGAPFDGGTSYRPGARFAPEAIRLASVLGRGYSFETQKHLFKDARLSDLGDIATTPQNIAETHRQIEAQVSLLLDHNVKPFVVGGDHSTTIGTLEAVFKKHGPFGIVHFDAHTDIYPSAWGCDTHHGTFMRHGHERGWFVKDAVVQLGIRGPYNGKDDLQTSKDYGYTVVTCDDLFVSQNKAGFDALKNLKAKKVPIFVSFDIDCLDPSVAPGTGTPVPGGLSTLQAFHLIRALKGTQIIGADLVEVCPAYDPAGITSLCASAVMLEILALMI